MSDRPHIPAETVRAVLVEAGHRCAIPTCRTTTTEIAHIVPWAKTQDDSLGNLIALCPTCHARYDQKGEIDLRAMRMYKQNLAILNNRYGEIERRLFTILGTSGETEFVLGMGGDILVANALADGLFVDLHVDRGESFYLQRKDRAGNVVWKKNFPTVFSFGLTERGKEFIQRFVEGEDLS